MQKFIMPMARNSSTGVTVKSVDLAGRRYQPHETRECRLLAERLAQQMTARTGETWEARIVEYSA